MAIKGRYGSRRLLVQALYQWQISGHSEEELRAQFADDDNYPAIDQDYFAMLLTAVIDGVEQLDQDINQFADRASANIDPVERSILLMGMAELRYREDVPPRVVINEAVELAKQFGSQDGHRYINAVLDKAATALRSG